MRRSFIVLSPRRRNLPSVCVAVHRLSTLKFRFRQSLFDLQQVVNFRPRQTMPMAGEQRVEALIQAFGSRHFDMWQTGEDGSQDLIGQVTQRVRGRHHTTRRIGFPSEIKMRARSSGENDATKC